MAGPLDGVRVVELAGQGPGPFAGMMLAGLGAEIIRIDRADRGDRGGGAGSAASWGEERSADVLGWGRRSVALDLKDPRGVEAVLRIVSRRDVLIEGYRPGVMERLGLGPDVCLARRPSLVYGRMTGWGQEGPYARRAGHDLNYLALTGALHSIGSAGGPPVPPLNLVADFGGGGMLLALGVVSALWEAARSGRGQVVDAAMVDGVATLMTPIYALIAAGEWSERRGSNIVDSGAHFYGVYQTSDDLWVSVAAIEPRFYRVLMTALGFDVDALPGQMDRATWPDLRRRVADVFRTRTRDEWTAALEPLDACFAPVLTPTEAHAHPHLASRGTFIPAAGSATAPRPAPAPRFGRTSAEPAGPPPRAGQDTDEILAAAGYSADEIKALRRDGVAG